MTQRYDKVLLIVVMVLVSLGVVMVFSATSIMCEKTEKIGDAYYYLKKELFRAAVGALAMMVAFKIDYRKYKRFSGLIIGIAGVLIAGTAIPALAGDAVKGATRWIRLGEQSLQPSEFVKVAIVLFLAEYLSRKAEKLDDFKNSFAPAVAVIGAFVVFIALQPNYGMAISITIVSTIMLFVAGVPMRFLAYIGAPGAVLLGFGVMHSDHARTRILTFLQGGDPLGSGFQINQSLIALGTGGLVGKGLGNGVQKLFYVPEIHTDFIFAVIGEEFGFLGTIAVMSLFLIFCWRGLKIAMRAPDRFGCNLAIGLTSMIFVYAALNVGVVLKLLPTTGIPLPFISYGGSALVVTMASCGVLLNISSHATKSLEAEILLGEEYAIGGTNANNARRRWNRRTFDPGFEYSSGTQVPPSGN